ncbi:MAG: NAD(P)H-quinone oxidoreductase [Pyrinomonadaceae bacterium]|nr:NAD(P)H-quinone oxidoreductase [Pyrinomonadaceae bacterium]
MRAVYISEFGRLDAVEVRDVAAPDEPGGDAVLVKVHAAGVNRADILQAKGLYPPPPAYSAHLPGLEFAGEIAAVGNSLLRWKTGDRVFGIVPAGGQSEFLLTHSALVTAIPDTLSYSEAAAVPEAFITAHDAIITQAAITKGEKLLIHAVGSGVGLAALQLGKAVGATVIGTSRTADKLERCKPLGLDVSVLTDGGDFAKHVLDATHAEGVSVILDLVGGAYFQQNLACLAEKGRLMLVGLTSGRKAEFDLGLALQKRLTIKGTVLRSRSPAEKAGVTERFADGVVPLLASGQISPAIDSIFSVSQAADAYARVESNANFGKVVLEF